MNKKNPHIAPGRTLLIPVAAMVALFSAVHMSAAANISWSGAADTIWSNNANWTGGVAPTSADNAIFSSVTPSVNLNGANVQVNAIEADANVVIGGSGSLTLGSGTLTKTGSGRFDLNASIVLGASAVWGASTSGAINGVKVTGVIDDGANSFGLKWTAGDLQLNGANTFDGGVEVAGGSVYVQNNQALGTGALTVTKGDVYFGAATIGNAVTFAKSDTTATNLRASSSVANFGYQTTFTNTFGGNLNGGALSIRGSAMTWIFQGGVSFTNASAAGLFLYPESTGSNSTYIFSSSPSVAGAINGRITLGSTSGSSATGGRGNLLVDQATTFSGVYLDVNNGGGIDTIGGMHASGVAAYTMSNSIRLYDTSAGAVNFVSLNSGATTRFNSKIDDSVATGAVAVTVNADYQQVDSTASLGLSAPVYVTKSSTGIVDFANAAGNTYRGGTTVYAGQLLVNNTSNSGTGSGSVLIKSGATLGGTGIIAPTGANGIVFQSGSVLAPGSGAAGTLRINAAGVSVGQAVLTMQSGASLSFELGASGAGDRVQIWNFASGDVAFSDNTINFSAIAGQQIEAGATYTLFSFFSDSGSSSVTSTGITSGLQIGTGLEGFTGSYLNYTGSTIDLVVGTAVIPEPSVSTFCGVILCAGMIHGMRRRRVLVGKSRS